MRTWIAPLALAATFLVAPAPATAGPADKDWSDHMGNIPFIVGSEKGIKEAEFTGKPILYFFTATW